MKIGIIGGGISGLTLANCLQHYSIPYTLFEKSNQFGEFGAGIGISESANTIFKKIGLGDDIKTKGCFVEDAIIVNKDGKTNCVEREFVIHLKSDEFSIILLRFGNK